MKVQLMYPDRHLDLGADLPAQAKDLIADLQLEPLIEVAAAADQLVETAFQQALLSPLDDIAEIEYRQETLQECVEQEVAVRQLYTLAGQALDEKRQIMISGFFRDRPSTILHRGTAILSTMLPYLHQVRRIADGVGRLSGAGLDRFVSDVLQELSEDYFAEAAEELRRLEFPGGMIIGKQLGIANKGEKDTLHAPSRERFSERVGLSSRSLSFQIAPRDMGSADALADLQNHGINKVADAVGRAGDHVLGFFTRLRSELAFYVGCVNLRRALIGDDGDQTAVALCWPRPKPVPTTHSASELNADGLTNPCLALSGTSAVHNAIEADSVRAVVITGANSGGKSTFLRSLGIAHLMMHAGMFVCARSWTASLRTGIFTHFAREEDATMTSGRFDEELKRMSSIVQALRPGGLVLMNESFASTNEGEGARVGIDVLRGLIDAGVTVVMVTHLYELARAVQAELSDLLFLRAERLDDGSRSYRLLPGGPRPTSHGQDIYQRLAPWPGGDSQLEPDQVHDGSPRREAGSTTADPTDATTEGR